MTCECGAAIAGGTYSVLLKRLFCSVECLMGKLNVYYAKAAQLPLGL